MDKMARLARDVGVLEEKLALCTRCGVCQASCPLFARTRKETDVSRGKLALISALIQNLFDDPKGVMSHLDRCLLCGSCAHGCPSNVNVPEIFIMARGIISRYLGLSFARKLMFQKVLADPASFNRVTKMAALFQPLLFKHQENIQGTSCARVASPLLRHRHIVPLKAAAFHERLDTPGFENLDFRKNGKGVRAVFFVGCLIDKAFPNVAFSTVAVLKHFRTQVLIPPGQGCCGIPALAAGETGTFERLVRAHVDLFSGLTFDYLVTACATCSSTIIKLWPALIKDAALKEKAAKIAERTVDISWLMVRRFGVSRRDTGSGSGLPAVTYHDPCHLRKSLDVFEEPRQVIRAAGRRLVEMVDSDACCGMGGSFNLKYYDISAEIGGDKANRILETGCRTVATSCPA